MTRKINLVDSLLTGDRSQYFDEDSNRHRGWRNFFGVGSSGIAGAIVSVTAKVVMTWADDVIVAGAGIGTGGITLVGQLIANPIIALYKSGYFEGILQVKLKCL